MIAHAHETSIGSGLPHLIDFPWATADAFRRSLIKRNFGKSRRHRR